MCGIIGIFGEKTAGEKIKEGLKLLQVRGKDGFGIASNKKIFVSKARAC
jgi:glucosamine 6-phosphate synthetase-like amidotransferase/phosphosugar isomerase protein